MNRLVSLLLTALLSLGFAVGLSACGSDEKTAENAVEKALEKEGKDVDVDIDKDGESGTFSVKDKDGKESSMTYGKELPDGWPKDIPLPDDAEIEGATSVAGASGDGYFVNATVEQSADEVMDFYKKELDGYTEENSMSADTGSITTYSNDTYQLMVSYTSQDGKKTMSLSLTKKQK